MTMDPTRSPSTVGTSPSPAGAPPGLPSLRSRPHRRRASSGGVLNLLLIGAAIVAIGGVAFAVGRIDRAAQRRPGSAARAAPGGIGVTPDGSFDPGARRARRPRRSTAVWRSTATSTAVDADSVTLTLADGQEMTFDPRRRDDVPRGDRRHVRRTSPSVTRCRSRSTAAGRSGAATARRRRRTCTRRRCHGRAVDPTSARLTSHASARHRGRSAPRAPAQAPARGRPARGRARRPTARAASRSPRMPAASSA